MDVFWHNDVAQYQQTITASRPLKNSKQQVSSSVVIKQELAAMATEGNEMLITRAMEALQSVRHELKSTQLRGSVCEG